LNIRCGNRPSNKMLIRSICVVGQLSSFSHYASFYEFLEWKLKVKWCYN
jgi:hypothetical protein